MPLSGSICLVICSVNFRLGLSDGSADADEQASIVDRCLPSVLAKAWSDQMGIKFLPPAAALTEVSRTAKAEEEAQRQLKVCLQHLQLT